MPRGARGLPLAGHPPWSLGNVAARLDPAGVSQTHISSGGQRRSVTVVAPALVSCLLGPRL